MFGLALWQVLGTSAALACVFGDPRQVRASVALFCNWVVLTDFAEITGNQYEVTVNMAVDWTTAIFGVCSLDWIALCDRRRFELLIKSWGQATLLATFGLGMIFHADWLIKELSGDDPKSLSMIRPYWFRFHYLAWVQALIVVLWISHDGFRIAFRMLSNRLSVWPFRHRPNMGCATSMRGER